MANHLAFQQKEAGSAPLGRGLLPGGHERAIGDADGREVEKGSKVKGQAGPSRMIQAGGVQEQPGPR